MIKGNAFRQMYRNGIIGGGEKYNRVIFDDFGYDVAAGSVNGTFADGPGRRAVSDSESKISVSGGRLVWSARKAVPGAGDPAYWLGAAGASGIEAITLNDGYAAVYDVLPTATNTQFDLGFDDGVTGAPIEPYISFLDTGAINIKTNSTAAIIQAYTAARVYPIVIALSSIHLFGLLDKSTNQIELLWQDSTTPPATGYLALQSYDALFSSDRVGIVDMSSDSNFASDYAAATTHKTGAHPSYIGNFTDGVHEADFFMHARGSVPSSCQAVVRQQDASNGWLLFFNGGTLTLYEFIAGVPTSRGTGAYPVGSAFNLDMRFKGADISIYVDGARIINYGSASSFSTATSFSCSSGLWTEWTAWPLTIDLEKKVF